MLRGVNLGGGGYLTMFTYYVVKPVEGQRVASDTKVMVINKNRVKV